MMKCLIKKNNFNVICKWACLKNYFIARVEGNVIKHHVELRITQIINFNLAVRRTSSYFLVIHIHYLQITSE